MLSNSSQITQSHGSADVSKQARALTGTVTKLLDNFGFIDDSVFFQLSVVKGGDVQVGDKVYCECSYSEHLPFKWNATKVHLVQIGGRGPTAQSVQSGAPTAASQVATTYLQHRLQQQQQQSREEPNNPMGGINPSHNYYSSQSVGNASYASQQSFDFTKAQQAVAAAQQLANYYGTGRSETNSFSQLQYTSTPGSAFVSSTLPFTQQIQQNLLSTQPRTAASNSFKSSASRWEREERTPRVDRARDNDRNRNVDSGRKRNDSRDRNMNGKEGRDEFGRDLRANDKSKEREREREKERERERERIEKERERRYKRSVSPTNSIGSQPTLTRIRRRPYEPVNIPKLAILKSPLNVYDIKQRYSANLHIPSDLKEVIINSNFSLNIYDIPKPITFRVIELKDENKKKESPKGKAEGKADSPKENKDTEKTESKEENTSKADPIEVDETSNSKSETKTKEKSSSVEHPISSKQTYKYGVKVLLIAVPSLAEIIERMFGSDFDAVPTGTKSYFLHFNKLLSFLVSRNSNDGFSLIGGKFNPQVDGYLPESEEPNLIATAIRIVGEQTGMNLTKCGKWKLIASFVYNRDSSVDPMTPHLELTRVFMPDVWSAFDTIYETLKTNKNINELENDNQIVLSNDKIENNSEVIVSTNDKNESISAENNNNINDFVAQEVATVETNASPSVGVEPSPDSNTAMDLSQTNEVDVTDPQSTDSSVPIVETTTPTVYTSGLSSEAIDLTQTEAPVVDPSVVETPAEAQNDDSSAPQLNTSVVTDDQAMGDIGSTSVPKLSSGDVSELQQLLSRINDLKVTELRAELEKRGVRPNKTVKKADLIINLRQIITQLLEEEDLVSDEVKNDWWAQKILSKESAADDTNPEDSQENIEDKKDDDIIDEEALLSDDPIPLKQTTIPNDVVMNETESNKDFEIIDEVKDKTEEEMVVDLSEDTTNNENKDNEIQSEETKESESQKSAQNGTVKRKSDNEDSPPKESKKAKNGEVTQEVIPTKVTDGCVYVKGGENLTVITLHEALNHQRYDQFEMSVVSEVIRESLIHHFSHYILSTLVFNYKNPLPKDDKSSQDSKTPLAVNYVHLSFAYFDSNHCGHILSEDLAKLLNNSNFTLSRRAFNLLVNTEDKVQYRDLLEPKELTTIKAIATQVQQSSDGSPKALSVKIYEREGTIYDIEQLIDQSESDGKLKVRLNEELSANKEKILQLSEYIQELEGRQKKMTIATEKQNDEICSLKREKEIIKNKYDLMRKTVETSVSAFSKLLDKEKEEKEKEDNN